MKLPPLRLKIECVPPENNAPLRASSAESGVTGNSADAVISDIQMQSGRDVSRIKKNRENGVAEPTQQARARGSEINGQLAQSLVLSASSAYSRARTRSK